MHMLIFLILTVLHTRHIIGTAFQIIGYMTIYVKLAEQSRAQIMTITGDWYMRDYTKYRGIRFSNDNANNAFKKDQQVSGL